MTTKTDAMGDVNPAEAAFEASREEEIRKRRQEGAAKARAALEAKRAEAKESGIVPKKKSQRVDEWFSVFTILMRNREIRVIKDVPSVIAETDAIIELLEDEDKI